MNQDKINKKFSTIDYAVLNELDISVAEMAYLDMVYYLSRAGSEWCYKSLNSIALDFNTAKSTIQSMRDRLIDKELLIRNKQGWVKTTEPVHNSYSVRISYDNANNRTKNSPYRTKNVRNRTKFSTKSNNRVIIESEAANGKPLASNKSLGAEYRKLRKQQLGL